MYKCDTCATDERWCKSCRDNPKYANYPRLSYFREYKPVCPQGWDNCVNDPAYIKFRHPEYYKKLYGDKTPEEAAVTACSDDECYYDDEDK